MDLDLNENPSSGEITIGQGQDDGMTEFPAGIDAVVENCNRIFGRYQLLPSALESDEDEEHNCTRVRNEPPEVKRRVKAILKINLEVAAMRADLAREIQQREFEFAIKMKPLEEKRQAIVTGTHEPTDEECDLTGIPGIVVVDDEDPKDKKNDSGQQSAEVNIDLNKVMEKMAIGEQGHVEGSGATPTAGLTPDLGVTGIPNFWSEVLQGSSTVAGLMEDHDLPILKYLENVTVDAKINNETDPPCFPGAGDYILRFHFGTNPFFTNKVLTKSFLTRCSAKPNAPMAMVEEPWPISATGCEINWIEGRNVTMEVVKRKQHHRGRGGVRFVVNTMEKTSFFNFFKTYSATDLDMKEDLEDDFRIGEFIRKKIIPFAALYYSLPDDMDNDGDIDSSSDEEEVEESITLRKRDRNRKCVRRVSLVSTQVTILATREGQEVVNID